MRTFIIFIICLLGINAFSQVQRPARGSGSGTGDVTTEQLADTASVIRADFPIAGIDAQTLADTAYTIRMALADSAAAIRMEIPIAGVDAQTLADTAYTIRMALADSAAAIRADFPVNADTCLWEYQFLYCGGYSDWFAADEFLYSLFLNPEKILEYDQVYAKSTENGEGGCSISFVIEHDSSFCQTDSIDSFVFELRLKANVARYFYTQLAVYVGEGNYAEYLDSLYIPVLDTLINIEVEPEFKIPYSDYLDQNVTIINSFFLNEATDTVFLDQSLIRLYMGQSDTTIQINKKNQNASTIYDVAIEDINLIVDSLINKPQLFDTTNSYQGAIFISPIYGESSLIKGNILTNNIYSNDSLHSAFDNSYIQNYSDTSYSTILLHVSQGSNESSEISLFNSDITLKSTHGLSSSILSYSGNYFYPNNSVSLGRSGNTFDTLFINKLSTSNYGAIITVEPIAIGKTIVHLYTYETFIHDEKDTIDWSLGNTRYMVLNDTVVMTFLQPPNTCNLTLKIINDNSNTNYLMTWPSNVLWEDGIPFMPSNTFQAVDIIEFFYHYPFYYAIKVGNDFKPYAPE